MRTVQIDHKDPDLIYKLEGLSDEALGRIRSKAYFGEYYLFEITFDETGEPVGVKQLDANPVR